jgi:ATP-dependent RNA helicase DDX27
MFISVYVLVSVVCIHTHSSTYSLLGGLSLKVQEAELRNRPDIVIATPGRLIDHVRNSQSFSLENIEILVMDEADR